MKFVLRFGLTQWVQAGLFIALVCIQFLVSRLDWTTETVNRPDLRQVRVDPGYRLTLRGVTTDSGVILSYAAGAGHLHRIELDLWNARVLNIPSPLLLDSGRYTLAPDASLDKPGHACTASLRVELKAEKTQIPFLRLWSALPNEFLAHGERTIRIAGPELEVVFSNDNGDGESGPGCHSILTTPRRPVQLGPNLPVRFAAEQVDVTMTPDPKSVADFHSGGDPFEDLSVEPLRAKQLVVDSTGGGTSPILDLRRAAKAPFAVQTLLLGRSDLQFTLIGPVAIPISRILGVWRWPLFGAACLVLFGWIVHNHKPGPVLTIADLTPGPDVASLPPGQKWVFLSYSWGDRERVMPVHDALAAAGGNPWMDRREMRGGEDWQESIKTRLHESRHALIFLSSGSLSKGGYAWKEMRIAADLAKEQPEGSNFLIPIKLEDCKIPQIIAEWNAIELYQPGGLRLLLESVGLGTSAEGCG